MTSPQVGWHKSTKTSKNCDRKKLLLEGRNALCQHLFVKMAANVKYPGMLIINNIFVCVCVFRGAHASFRTPTDDCVVDPRWPSSSPNHLPEHAPLWQSANQLAWCYTIRGVGALVCQSPPGLQERQEAGVNQWHHWEWARGGASFLCSPSECPTGVWCG